MISIDYTRRNLALAFAARAHRNQIRKGTENNPSELGDLDKQLGIGVPYLMHPAAVGMILLEHGASDDAVIAGILHDVVEDAKIPIEVLEAQFGKAIARLVVAESEPDKSLPWRDRKQHTLDYLAESDDLDVKLIAAADKLHNVQSIQLDLDKLGDGVWDRFSATKEEQAWYYHGICQALTGKGEEHPLFERLRETVAATFGATG